MKIKSGICAIVMMVLLFNLGSVIQAGRAEDKQEVLQNITYISEIEPLVTVITAEDLPVAAEAESLLSEEEIALIALLTMAEAEGECEEGQRLVIDTVLNRVDNPHFPNSVRAVVYQPNQYAGMKAPRINHCWVKDELVQLVREEATARINSSVVFFRTGRYSKYGTPAFKIGHHYFSTY